jgi:hypothetical protein
MHAHDIHVLPTPVQRPQGIATVIAAEPEGLCVDDGHARFVARRATSCLVEPMPGDRVWVVSQGEHFVIAVLDRPVASKTRLHLDGDVELHASGALELTGERRLALQGDELHVEARTGRVLLDRCVTVLGTLCAHLRETTLVGKVLETLVERVSQHSKRSYRAIAEIDQVQAGALDYGAEQVMHLHAKTAMVRAEQLVKMDADQIHLG